MDYLISKIPFNFQSWWSFQLVIKAPKENYSCSSFALLLILLFIQNEESFMTRLLWHLWSFAVEWPSLLVHFPPVPPFSPSIVAFVKILPIPYWHSICNLNVLTCILNSLTYNFSFLWFDSFLVLILSLYSFIINLLLFCLVILLCLEVKYYFLYIFVSSPVLTIQCISHIDSAVPKSKML